MTDIPIAVLTINKAQYKNWASYISGGGVALQPILSIEDIRGWRFASVIRLLNWQSNTLYHSKTFKSAFQPTLPDSEYADFIRCLGEIR